MHKMLLHVGRRILIGRAENKRKAGFNAKKRKKMRVMEILVRSGLHR